MSESQTRESTLTKAVNAIAGLPICAVGVAMPFALDNMASHEDLRTPRLLTAWAIGAWFIVALGAIVEIVGWIVLLKYSTPQIVLMSGEEKLDERNPSNVSAYFWMALGALSFPPPIAILPFLQASYAAVGVADLWVAVAMLVYLRGTLSFWKNQHTVYYATNFRAVRMHRLLGVDTLSMPVERINAVHVTRSFTERLTSRGSASVYAGRLVMRIRGIDNPGEMAETVLEQMRRSRSRAGRY